MQPPFLLRLGLILLCLSFARADDTLHVGVAHTDITPLPGVDKFTAMGGRVVTVDQIHDPLLANVIIFQNGADRVALVSLDLIWLQPEAITAIREQITAATGISHVICALTHTHGSGRPSPEYNERILPRIVAAAAAAQARLEPAVIGYGQGELAEGYNRRTVKPDGTVDMLWNNRDRLPTAPIDPAVGVMSIRRASDHTTLATLVNYSVHPVISMNFTELIVSADFPGAMARQVEAELGGRCIFLLGAAGDINPFDADMFRYATVDETFAAIDRLATALSTQVTRITSDITTYHPAASLAFDRYDLPMASRSEDPHAAKQRAVELDTFLIGNRWALVTIPGELFVALGLELKQRSPAEATWIVANCNAYHGYIPTLQATTEGGYGATSGTQLEVGAGERLIQQALVSIHHQMDLVKPLD